MPFVAENERVITQADGVAFGLFWFFDRTMKWLFWLGIVLGTARLLVIVFLTVRTRWQKKHSLDESFQPFVSVIVPAFNEEKSLSKL